jgi:prophage maintenance system killer protein
LATDEAAYLTYAEAVVEHIELMRLLEEVRYRVFDRALLDSALARPRHAARYEGADLPAQAATLCYGLIKNHPSVGGNKRTATHLTARFLKLNGLEIVRHRKLKEFVSGLGITDENDYDAYFDLFYEEDTRFEFLLLFREFSRALDAVYPREEALDFLPDFKHYSEINVMASRHFRDARLSMKGVPEKLRRIADEHLVSKGIEQTVEPVPILDRAFQAEVGKRTREKTKAAEIEHAFRHHLDINFDVDPELCASFAEAIEEMLREFKDNWKLIRQKLGELRQKIAKAEKEENTYGLHRRKQMPFFRIFRKEIFDGQELNDDQIGQVIGLTKQTTGTPKNNLNFNWRLIKAPMRVIEYVVVHELTHLLEPNHTADFWAIVRNQLPDYLKSKEWLKRAGGLVEVSP